MKPAHPVLGDGFVHYSNLRHLARSAAHYRVAVERRTEPTPAMRFGSLVHALLLGGVEVAVWQGTRSQAGYKAFALEHADKLLVTGDEHDRAQLCAAAVMRDPVAGPLVVGSFERKIEWEYQDRACSSRLDIISPEGDIDELKTTTNSEPETFARACLKMGYHGQLAFYRRAAQSIGITPRRSRIIAVETQPPFVVTVLTLSPRTLLVGEKLCRKLMERLLACEAIDSWPGYIQSDWNWDLDEEQAEGMTIDGEEVEAA